MKSFGHRRVLWALFALGLAARLTVVAVRPFWAQDVDFDRIAVNLLAGQGFQGHGHWTFRPPGYPIFLAAVFTVFGHSTVALELVQAVLGAATCALVFLAGARLFGSGVGLAAGLISTFFYDLAYTPRCLLAETVYNVLLVLGILVWPKRAGDDTGGAGRSVLRAVAAGLVFGMATLTKTFTVLLPGLVAVWALVDLKARARTALLVMIGFCVPIVPWTARNYKVHHAFVPFSTQGGAAFWGGNNPWARGLWDHLHLPIDTPEYLKLSEPARDRAYYREGLAYLKTLSPGQLMKLAALKVGGTLYPFRPRYDVTYTVLLPFTVWGLWLARRREGAEPLWMLLACMLGTTLIFWGGTRMRDSFAVVFVLFGALGLAEFWTRVRHGRSAWLGGWVAVNLAVLAWGEPLRMAFRSLRG